MDKEIAFCSPHRGIIAVTDEMNMIGREESMEEPRKFSVIAYSQQVKSKSQRNAAHRVQSDSFKRVVEDMRNFIIAYRAKSSADQTDFGEMLNRAVLGFYEERRQISAVIQDELIKRRLQHIPPPPQFQSLGEAVFAEIVGLNVLELVLRNKEGLEEIQVVGTRIFEVRNGMVSRSPYSFADLKDVERIQQNLVLYNNDVLNEGKRWAETRLSDGSRVTMTRSGFTSEPTITIRFYAVRTFSLQALCEPEHETIDEKAMHVLRSVLRSYFNIVIIGPTNSGKTHLMKALIAELPDHERIVTIESNFELMLKRDFPEKNIIEYEADEDDENHSSSRAFKLALRQSPQRICNAEIRDEDANIYVRACTRGHPGSMTTVHVNALEDVPDAITDMCMLDRRGMDPARMVKRITQYVTQIGIEMAVVKGKRKVVRIAQFNYDDGEVQVIDLVRYNEQKSVWEIAGKFTPRGAEQIKRHDPEGYKQMQKYGLVRICTS